MALSEGGSMSNYGKTIYSPQEQSAQWIEQVKKEEHTKKTHKVLTGDETVINTYFKGQKPDKGPDPSKNISYYNNYKERPQDSLYERTFKVENDYSPKLHRDDRQHKVGLDLYSEISNKAVTTTSTQEYGKRPALEALSRQHVKVNIINKEFYRSSGNVLGQSS